MITPKNNIGITMKKIFYTVPLFIITVSLLGISCSQATSSAGDIILPSETIISSELESDVEGGYPATGSETTPTSSYPDANKIVPTPISPQTEIPPGAGYGNLTGSIISRETGSPVTNVPLQLAKVEKDGGQGVFFLDTAQSPFTEADINGFFVFQSIEPGEYVLVIGSVENQNYEISSQPAGQAITYFIVENESINIGDIPIQELRGYETK